jgi:pimeloyl-ACP methyl ester carboxylesterase
MARLVLVHGAFGGAWCWEPVVGGLREAGHAVETLDLPGQGQDTTPISEVSLDAYEAKVSDLLALGEPAVLVGHSMGGMVITQAASRSAEHVRTLIYVAAFVPQDGESLLELTHRPEAADDQIQQRLVVEGEPPVASLSPEDSVIAVYNCCTPEQVEWALARRSSQPVVPFTQPLALDPSRADAFAALPRSYITCLRDQSIPPPMQRFMFERAGCDPVVEIDTDHAPYLSRTDELVAALDQLASRER